MSIGTERPEPVIKSARSDQEEVEPTSNGHAPASLLGRIQAERSKRMEDEHLLLGVPTWGNDLVAKFAVLGEEERERAAKKLDRGDDSIDFHVTVLSGACRGLYMRDPESDELVRLETDGIVAKFDELLAAMLDIEATSNREVLMYLVQDNAIALNAYGQKVLGWMQDTSQEVEGALLGESLA